MPGSVAGPSTSLTPQPAPPAPAPPADVATSNGVASPTAPAPLASPAAPPTAEELEEQRALAARRKVLKLAQRQLFGLPEDEYFEVAGRPSVVYQVRDYTHERLEERGSKLEKIDARTAARSDFPFLFKAFETGQAPPPRPGTKKASIPRAATIHEYLDWTVTSPEPEDPGETDFGGFRVIVLLPRYRPGWPAPGAYDNEAPRSKFTGLGAPRPALPVLMVHNKPICAATVRLGPGYIEVPFFATTESRRNRGYGRALLEAIEEVARALHTPRILLCSTDEPVTKATWRRMGFSFSTAADLKEFKLHPYDLLHMDNTVQMHKLVPPARKWRSIIIKHDAFRQRVYACEKAPSRATTAATGATVRRSRKGNGHAPHLSRNPSVDNLATDRAPLASGQAPATDGAGPRSSPGGAPSTNADRAPGTRVPAATERQPIGGPHPQKQQQQQQQRQGVKREREGDGEEGQQNGLGGRPGSTKAGRIEAGPGYQSTAPGHQQPAAGPGLQQPAAAGQLATLHVYHGEEQPVVTERVAQHRTCDLRGNVRGDTTVLGSGDEWDGSTPPAS